jgi:hypothetical protein
VVNHLASCKICWIMATKRTHGEYEQELFSREIDYWPMEEYIGGHTPILHECLKGHTWSIKPSHILSGIGCPYCYGNNKKSTEEYIGLLVKENFNYTPLEEYIGTHTPILHRCEYSHEWKARPHDILKGQGCPKCNNVGKYNNTFFTRYPDKANEPGILYCVVLVNKSTRQRECIKIGITKGTSNRNVLKRALGFKGYDVRVQKTVMGTLQQVFNLEQELHRRWANNKFVPESKFGGWTELFELNNDIIKSIPDKL